eukprot:COSAG02_NODE_1827_length_10743_cov_19.183859_2_plen_56_part_00
MQAFASNASFCYGVRVVVAATTPAVTWCHCGALEGGEPGAGAAPSFGAARLSELV